MPRLCHYTLPSADPSQWALILSRLDAFDAKVTDNTATVDDYVGLVSQLSTIPMKRLLLLKGFLLGQRSARRGGEVDSADHPVHDRWHHFRTLVWPIILKQAKRLPSLIPSGHVPQFGGSGGESHHDVPPPCDNPHCRVSSVAIPSLLGDMRMREDKNDPPRCTDDRATHSAPHQKIRVVSSIALSVEAIAALLAHMFLGTLHKPPHLEGGNKSTSSPSCGTIAHWASFVPCWFESSLELYDVLEGDDDEDDETVCHRRIAGAVPSTIAAYAECLFDYFDGLENGASCTTNGKSMREVTFSAVGSVGVPAAEAGPQSPALPSDLYASVLGALKDVPIRWDLVQFELSGKIGGANDDDNNDSREKKRSTEITGGDLAPQRRTAQVDVDFANHDVGFGKHGTQEELLFGMSPEMSVVVLLNPSMDRSDPSAAVSIRGARIVGGYTGYGKSIQYNGKAIAGDDDENWMRRVVLAIDALPLDEELPEIVSCQPELINASPLWAQFSPTGVARDLAKAISGVELSLRDTSSSLETAAAINSGHWGCGAFGGFPLLKFVQQVVAISTAVRHTRSDREPILKYHLFGDTEFQAEAQQLANCYPRASCVDLLKIVNDFYVENSNGPFSRANIFATFASTKTSAVIAP